MIEHHEIEVIPQDPQGEISVGQPPPEGSSLCPLCASRRMISRRGPAEFSLPLIVLLLGYCRVCWRWLVSEDAVLAAGHLRFRPQDPCVWR